MSFLRKKKSLLWYALALVVVAVGATWLFQFGDVSLVMSGKEGDRVQCVVRYDDGQTDRHELVMPATLVLRGSPQQFEFELTNLSGKDREKGERVDVLVHESHERCSVRSTLHDGRVLTGKVNFTSRFRVSAKFADKSLDAAAEPNA